MSRVKILPEILSNKIAAGEVIERPASVVKELVENALDAESTRIIIEIGQGGRSLIQVSDNGKGMNRDDAMLAIERYATSKIAKDEDLFAISSLGFRGEALPSIASVSRFSLLTRDEASDTGTQIIIEGGKVKKVSEVGAPIGTMVSVKQLFFNIPARRKFLKTVTTEMGHIADTLTAIALSWPNVQFRLIHNGKIVQNRSAVKDPFDRIADVLGQSLKNHLYKIESTEKDISISGYTSSPAMTRSTTRGIYVYVNGRFVRDKMIQHALLEGYKGRLMKGRYPMAAMFINVPFDQVDVNVHPAKSAVKFTLQQKVHYAVVNAVRTAPAFGPGPDGIVEKIPRTPPVFEKTKNVAEQINLYGGQDHAAIKHPAESLIHERNDLYLTGKYQTAGSTEVDEKQAACTYFEQKIRFSDLYVIGQFKNTYVVGEFDDGLIIIDQHAAHERILFEKLKKRFTSLDSTSQKLLIPETVDLGYREAVILESLLTDLGKTGLEIEPFGGNTFVVKAVPGILSNREIKPLIVEIVEKIAETGFAPGLEKSIDECLILMACHGAIRANQQLSSRQIRALLEQLDKCDQPHNCPHGRPTWIQWHQRSIEKSFGRIT